MYVAIPSSSIAAKTGRAYPYGHLDPLAFETGTPTNIRGRFQNASHGLSQVADFVNKIAKTGPRSVLILSDPIPFRQFDLVSTYNFA